MSTFAFFLVFRGHFTSRFSLLPKDKVVATKAHNIERANERKKKEAVSDEAKKKINEEKLQIAKARWESQKVLDGT